MTTPTIEHTGFVIERRLRAEPGCVYRAWSTPEIKRRWAGCHAEQDGLEHRMDFRPGGRETFRATLPDGRRQFVDTTYLELRADARIIFAYVIGIDSVSLSTSMVTVELHPDPQGTRLVLTEKLAYLDGFNDLQSRIQGTGEGLDRLALEVSDGLPSA